MVGDQCSWGGPELLETQRRIPAWKGIPHWLHKFLGIKPHPQLRSGRLLVSEEVVRDECEGGDVVPRGSLGQPSNSQDSPM